MGEDSSAYSGAHKGIGELQVNNYTFEEFTNQNPTPLKNKEGEFFAGFDKLKSDLGITNDDEAIEKYIELQKNQYRIMGLTRGFLYKDALMAMSSEYDHVDVSYVDEREAVNNNGRTCDWLVYDVNGNLYQWYSSAPAVDLMVNGERIGARYNQVMTSVLKADGSVGTAYPSANAIWKKLYQTTNENLLNYDPSDDIYKYMDVEVPVVTKDAGYFGDERVGFEYALNGDLQYYIPITNATDLVDEHNPQSNPVNSAAENLQILVNAFKQVNEFAVSAYCSYIPDTDKYVGKKMVIRIKGLTATDEFVTSTDVPTNDKMFSGMIQNWRDTQPATIRNAKGTTARLRFPEPKVSIREKTVVYDYGLKLVDCELPGFFSDVDELSDVDKLLAIDYMYKAQRQNGNLSYTTKYPYVGANGLDENGDSMTYDTEQSVKDARFEIGISDDKAYFEPHSISARDYKSAVLLKLKGTQKDVFGNDINKYEWCKLTILPATNVLYEAEQGVDDSNPVALANGKEKLEGDFGIFYSGRERSGGSWQLAAAWSVEGTSIADSAQQHYNKLYGYDPAYVNRLAQNANGAAMAVTVDHELYNLVDDMNAQWPVAKFTFEGSGFSFNTVCSLNTGIFAVDVVPHGKPASYDNGDAGTCLHEFVNTRYYGGVAPSTGVMASSPSA